MTTVTTAKAKTKLDQLLREASASHEPIQITGADESGGLASEEDWRSIRETLFLLSIPGMRRSIRRGMATPIEKCSKAIKW
jgi:PHD/YefM family antitoxin component YafN of YafNO toxin-antitoxin module